MSIRKTYKFANIVNAYQLSKIEDILRNEINRNHMVNGVYIENSKTISIGPDVCLEPKSIIRSGSIILGNSLIKSNAVIGPNSEISNSYIGENAIVAHSVVVDSSVGKGAMVGPFTHLRMHTSVGDYDRIGNFVEIKNSTIGEKTNISHLTYVGDTECGKGVNFGCGVVTVNYNGVSKFKTTIGNNVFIGCNSNLIAPIKIKNGAFIAAGSTITEDLEEYDFSIARMKQITKSGYAKKYGYKKYFEEDESLSS
jgi:bifunctional UDP-N-acetylglucosamine pyrophosphorylase/glucosamine-1-phosphate N-acetyltransferase